MGYELYYSNVNNVSPKKRSLYEKRCCDISLIEANETYEVERIINRRHITYYTRNNIAFSRTSDGDYPRVFICLGKEVSKSLHQIKNLFKCFTREGLMDKLINYPYILYAIDEDKNKNIKKKLRKIKDSRFEVQFEKKKACFIWFCSIEKKSPSEGYDKLNKLRALIDFADHLIYELKNFTINLNGLEKTEALIEYENAIIPPKLKYVLLVGGVIALKALIKTAAKSIGGDINLGGGDLNFDFDFDIPDIDFDGDLNLDFDSDFTPNFELDVPELQSSINPLALNEDAVIDFDTEASSVDLPPINDGILPTDSNTQNEIAFKQEKNEDKLLYQYKQELKQADKNIDYYTKELSKPDISQTYRNNCNSGLNKALSNYEEIAKKIDKLKK